MQVAPYLTYDPVAYSADGLIKLSYPTYVYYSSTAFVEALGAVDVSIVQNLNLGNNIGAKQEPVVLNGKQQRVSSYDGYYQPVKACPNLTVRPMCTVERIILEQRETGLMATGVIYTDLISGSTLNLTARKEVIVSAGTFQSPQL